jgi:hypothetical protein
MTNRRRGVQNRQKLGNEKLLDRESVKICSIREVSPSSEMKRMQARPVYGTVRQSRLDPKSMSYPPVRKLSGKPCCSNHPYAILDGCDE